MSDHLRRRHGQGTAWLVADRLHDDYLCYWYAGTNDGRLLERGRAATAADAVAWGRVRTPRVRIRTGDLRTYWAGTGASPAAFAHTWSDPDDETTGQPSTPDPARNPTGSTA